MRQFKDEQLKDALLKLVKVESANYRTTNSMFFELPIGTVFLNAYLSSYEGYTSLPLTAELKDKFLSLTSDKIKVRKRNINANGITMSIHCDANILKTGEANRLTNYRGELGTSYRHRYVTVTWEMLLLKENEVLRNVIKTFLAKVSPDYTVKKNGGVLTFQNNDTKDVLHCNLGKQIFSRSYRKGTDKVIKYPTQFFKYVSGRLLIDYMLNEAESDTSNFQTLIGLISKHYPPCRNFGTFLVKMFDHQHLEAYIAAGVNFTFDIPFKYNDFSKDIRQKLNENGITYTKSIGSLFCSDADTGRAIFAQIKDKVGFKGMVSLLALNIQALNTLITHYNYDLKAVFSYLRERGWKSAPVITDYYGQPIFVPDIENTNTEITNFSNYAGITYLRDYARMAREVYGETYERYPKDLKAAHDAVSVIHQTRSIDEQTQTSFKEIIDKSLEWKNKDFAIVHPTKASEIVSEGISLKHCVGSYVHSVVRRECQIVFLREKENLNTPFVTIEIVNKRIKQARAKGNTNPTYDARQALKDWAKAKNLEYAG